MATRSFATPTPVDLNVANGSGTVEIVAAATSESTVEVEGHGEHGVRAAEETVISFSEQSARLTVQPPEQRFGGTSALDIRVFLPEGSSVTGNTGSAMVSAKGRLARFTMKTGSGDIEADQIDGDARVGSGSGDIRLGAVAGDADAKTGSGNIEVDRAAGLSASSGSGDVRIGSVDGAATIKGASGDIAIGSVRQGAVVVTTASGSVSVGVAGGAVARLAVSSVSGDVSSDLPVDDQAPEGGSTVDLRLNTVSGDVSITRAAPAGTG